MFYAKLHEDGTLETYPYTVTDLILANPATSFPAQITDETVVGFNLVPVTPADQPAFDYKVDLSRTAEKQGDQWVEVWISTPASPEEQQQRLDNQWANVREDRNARLAACDWTQLPDSPVDKAIWATYRQELRDITQQADPFNIVWPTEP